MWADPRGGAAYQFSSFGRLDVVTGTGVSTLSYSPEIRDVSMPTSTSAFAVGWNLFLARWNGQSWTVDKPPTGTPSVRILQGVWSDGPNNAWAVGNSGTILRWNGTSWSVVSDILHPVELGGPSYNAVWGSGSTVLIGGTSGILRCSTGSCANDGAPPGGNLFGVCGTSTSNVFAVGAAGRILHYNGTAWTPMTSPTSRTLVRAWGSGASDVWAVGDSVLLHYDGTAWKSVPMIGDLQHAQSGVFSQFQGNVFQLGLWGSAANDVYLGGDFGQIIRWNGTEWRQLRTGSGHRVVGIAGVPGFGAIAVLQAGTGFGSAGSILRGLGPTGGMSTPMIPPASWP